MSGCHHAIRWLHTDATAGWARSVGGVCSKRRCADSAASTTSARRQTALCSIELREPHYKDLGLRRVAGPCQLELKVQCKVGTVAHLFLANLPPYTATSVHESDKEISPYSTRYAPSCTSYIGEASRRGTAVNTWVTRTSPKRRGAAATYAVVNTLSDPSFTLKTGRRSKRQYSTAVASVATSAVLAPTRTYRLRIKHIAEVSSPRGTR